MNRPKTRFSGPLLLILAAGSLSGCASPFGPDPHRQAFEKAIRDSLARETNVADTATRTVTRSIDPTDLEISDDVRAQLEAMAGPKAYSIGKDEPLGLNLEGNEQRTVGITLDQVRRTVLRNNLQLEFARLEPAVQEAQVVRAEAAFDWIFYQSLDYRSVDSPQQASATFGNIFAVGATVRDEVDWTAGIRRQLTSGGQFSVQQQLVYSDNESPGLTLFPDPASEVAYTVQLDQPLLRNFGSEVALQQVRLARNAERDAIAQLKLQLITVLTDAERTYWNLVGLHRTLQIQQKLLERGFEWADKLKSRPDATPAQKSEALSRVEQRRADILRTRTTLSAQSDQLRLFMNDPSLPLGSEVILQPLELPLDDPIMYNYAEALYTAARHRPEVEQAIISLDNTGIRNTTARNQLLPQLDLRLQARMSALDSNAGHAYRDAFDGRFVDWLVGLVFELPIGNRAAQANWRATQLQRMQATTALRQTIQSITFEVKAALRDLNANYELIAITERQRLAATDSLRTNEVRTINIGAFDPTSVTLLLDRQERLAAAEANEVQAQIDYMISIAELHAALGLTLERNRVEFVVPEPEDQFDWPANDWDRNR
jgi:outer membrane protein TolC